MMKDSHGVITYNVLVGRSIVCNFWDIDAPAYVRSIFCLT